MDSVIVVQSAKHTDIITERDLIFRMMEQGLDSKVVIKRALYTNPFVTIEETTTVEEAAKRMNEWKIKHLPVTNDGRITGFLIYLDIGCNVPSLMSEMKELYRPSK